MEFFNKCMAYIKRCLQREVVVGLLVGILLHTVSGDGWPPGG